MYDKIIKIYRRLTIVQTKNRPLIILISISSIVLSLVVLVISNLIVNNAKTSGELDYSQVKFFYNLSTYLFLVLVYVFVPFFFSNELNKLVNSHTFDYLIVEKIKPYEIVFATYFREFFNVIILIMALTPILSLTFFFSGIGFVKIFKISLNVFGFILVLSSICLYISVKIRDENQSRMLSYIICSMLLVSHCYYINFFIKSISISLLYVIFGIIMTLVLLTLSTKIIGKDK